jgi:hypothetical protein
LGIQNEILSGDDVITYAKHLQDIARKTFGRTIALDDKIIKQALNFKDVENIWAFLDEMSEEYGRPIIWWPITLSYPTHLALSAVTVEERTNHIENIKAVWNRYYYKPIYDGTFNIDMGTWNAYYNTIMNSPYNPENHKQLAAYVRFIDQQRLQDGELIFGDLL